MILTAYTYKSNRKLLYFILSSILLLISSCSSTRYISGHQSIVRKIYIDSLSEALHESAYAYIQKGIIPEGGIGVNRILYNIFNVKNGKYRTEGIKKIGTPPALLDSSMVEMSRKQIEKFLQSKGYLNATVRDSIRVKNKNAYIRFIANGKTPFKIQNINIHIPDTAFKQMYIQNIAPNSPVIVGEQYDEEKLVKLREQIFEESQHKGYYNFLRQYIHFEVDTNQNNTTAKLNLYIGNPEGKSKHQTYTIGHTNMIIAKNSEGFLGDSIAFNPLIENNVRFTDLSHKFRKNAILRYDFLNKGDLYDVQKEVLTINRLYQLNVFKNVKVDYTKNSDSTRHIIHPLIMLTPYKLMGNRVDVELPFNTDIVGLNMSNTFTNSNLFGGAERFEFQIGGGFYARTGNNIFGNIYQRNFSASANLNVPRLLAPFRIPLIAKNGVPHTTFSASYIYNLQQSVLLRQIFIGTVTYDWVETKSKLHSLSPLNYEYRFGNLLLSQRDLDTLRSISSYNYELLSRKNVTLGIKYAYDLNSDKLNTDRSFVYFRGTFESAGNLLSTLFRLSEKIPNPKNELYNTLLGVPYNQYIRPEIDIRWYKNLGYEKTLVLRLNSGVGYTYGNSIQLPFEKMFFAGGSTGVRAWQARTLGPGNYNRAILPDAKTRQALIGVDQLGDMLIQGNIEYRFMLAHNFAGGKIKGALFLDAGNTWSLSAPQGTTDFDNRVFKLNIKRLASQTALGAGFGIRYDVDYFVFRLDLGIKVKDPQFGGKDQWVIKHFLNNSAEFKREYRLAHAPDTYRFVQYNFGIGLPF